MKKTLKKILSAILPITLAAPACIPYHQSVQTQQTTQKLEEITAFNYTKTKIQLTSRKTIEKNKYFTHEEIRYKGAFSIPQNKDEVIAHYYTPTKRYENETFPLIEVFPILGGGYEVSEKMAEYFARRGFAVLSFERSGKFLRQEQPPTYPKEVIIRTIIDGRRGLDWAETQPEINKEKIGVAGTSLGSILAAMVAIADPRVKTGGFIMCGGDLAKILTISKEESIKKYREYMLKKENISLEEFLQITRQITLDIEPTSYAHNLNPNNFILITAMFDQVIPPQNAKILWESMGKPDWIRVASGHYTIFPYFFYANRKITDKFCETLNTEKRRPKGFW